MNFSWSDAIRACCSCFTAHSSPRLSSDVDTDHGPHHIRTARPDELQGLLSDHQILDADTETHSLHSHFRGTRSRTARERKLNGVRKRITLFGYDIFGQTPLRLPSEDAGDYSDGDDGSDGEGEYGQGVWSRRSDSAHTLSSVTLDLDAPPLDPSLIENLSYLASIRQPDTQHLLSTNSSHLPLVIEERPVPPQQSSVQDKVLPGSRPADATTSDPRTTHPFHARTFDDDDGDFGPFQDSTSSAAKPPVHQPPLPDDTADADLGGELYTRRTRSGKGIPDSRSQSGSQTSNAISPMQSPLHKHKAFVTGPDRPRTKKPGSSSSEVSSTTASQAQSSAPSSSSTLTHNPVPIESYVVTDSHKGQDEHLKDNFPSTGFGGKPRLTNFRNVAAFLETGEAKS